MNKQDQEKLLYIAGILAHIRPPLEEIDMYFFRCTLCRKVWHKWRFIEARDAGYHDPDCPRSLAIEFVYDIEPVEEGANND